MQFVAGLWLLLLLRPLPLVRYDAQSRQQAVVQKTRAFTSWRDQWYRIARNSTYQSPRCVGHGGH
jgi:hypothetical protein